METTITNTAARGNTGKPVEPNSRWQRCGLTQWVLGLGLLACAFGIHAQGNDDAPWIPQIIQSSDTFVPDPAFNNAHFVLDHFGGPSTADEFGGPSAQLSNGDTVVAGLVPRFGTTAACNNGTDLCSIGLVRYNKNGVRQAWTNPGYYGQDGNQYVIYPGGPYYEYIRHIQVRPGGFIDVLVDEVDSTRPGIGRQDVRIVTFHDDGAFLSELKVFGEVFPGNSVYDTRDFYGAQMVQINDMRMMVVATLYYAGGRTAISVARLNILPNGAPTPDQSFGSAYGGPNYTKVAGAPAFYCGAEYDCPVIANYASKQFGFATPTDFYVGASIQISGNNWDPIVLKISSDTGAPKNEFNGNGWSRVVFDEPGGNKDDRIAGLYVYKDDVYLAAQAAQKCATGVGIAKINGATGNDNDDFGYGGHIVYGGKGDLPACPFNGNQADVPTAISGIGGHIVVVGYRTARPFIQGSLTYDPMLAVVDAYDGKKLNFDAYPVTGQNGSRLGDAVLYSVHGNSDMASPITVAGIGRDTGYGNTLSYLTGRFIAVSTDRIFRSNFGGD